MIGRFFNRGSKRAFVNGVQEMIEVSTKTHDVAAPLWLADTYKLARHLSDGDRSTAVAANQAASRGDTATLMTADGSVTQELWARLTEFGYLVEDPDKALTASTKAWAVPLAMHQSWLMFMLAAKVDVLTDTVLVPISSGLSKKRGLFMKAPTQLLRIMRSATVRAEAPFALGTARAPHFVTFERLGLARIKGGNWVATQTGSLVVPYFLDHILCQKGEDEHEVKA